MKPESADTCFYISIALWLSGVALAYHYMWIVISVLMFAYLYTMTGLAEQGTILVLGYCVGSMACQILGVENSIGFWTPLPFSIQLASLSIAHLGEYLFVCKFHPKLLSWESFLIN
jgi:hypothetical protein